MEGVRLVESNWARLFVRAMLFTSEPGIFAELVSISSTRSAGVSDSAGVDARETEIGMSMKGLAENVSKEEQGDQVSIFDLAKELLADDMPATKKKASAKKSKSKQPIPAPPNPHDYFPATAGASAPAVA